MSMRKIARIISIALVLVMVAASLAGCAKQPAKTTDPGTKTEAPKTVKIGILYAVTGTDAAVGQDYVETAKACVDIVNKAHPELGDFPFAKTEGIPGLNGAKIELVVADSQNNPEVGATETERLITKEGVSVIVGGHMSGITKTATVAAEKLGVPFITGSSSSPTLTQRGLQFFFRVAPTDFHMSRDAFDFLDVYKDKLGLKNVAICAEEVEYGKLNQQLWEANAKERGYNIVTSFTYPSGPASVSAECIKIKQANPDVLFMASQASEAILYSKAFKDMDINPKVIMTARGGFIAQEWFDAVKEGTNYIVTANVWSLDAQPKKPWIQDINKIVKSFSGVDLNGNYAREFEAFFCAVDAINRAKSTDPKEIQKALLATNIGPEWLISPWGGIKFDEKHENPLAKGIITQIQNQKYVTVSTDPNAAVKPILPMPKWSERSATWTGK